MRTVAALYIDPRGPYPRMPGVECWGLPDRDARAYAGPHPVVAHPPCRTWSSLRHLSTGTDGECGVLAVDAVRAWGGVLEQPARSRLWDACLLPRPGDLPDAHGGYAFEASQVYWGHVARKSTWLYVVGVADLGPIVPPFPDREPTHWCSGGRKRGKGSGGLVPQGIKVCSAEQRRRTPPLFAELLVAIARSAG